MEDNKAETNGRKLKRVKLEDLEFTANGKRYFIEREISAERFAKMQEFEIEMSFGVTYEAMDNTLLEVYNLIQEGGRIADVAVIVHQAREGIQDIVNREQPILKYCTCFINRENEDRRRFDENIMADKIKDWEEEGMNHLDFFPLAVNSVRGLKENFKLSIQDTSKSE